MAEGLKGGTDRYPPIRDYGFIPECGGVSSLAASDALGKELPNGDK